MAAVASASRCRVLFLIAWISLNYGIGWYQSMRTACPILLLLSVMAGCARYDYRQLSAGLLTYESIEAIGQSVDPSKDVDPWYKMSRNELIRVLGAPDKISRSVDTPDIESLTYSRKGFNITFRFEGPKMFGFEYGKPVALSKPEYMGESFPITNPFRDFSTSNVHCIVFIGANPATQGMLFMSTDPKEIQTLYDMSSVLTNKIIGGPGCVSLVTVEFKDEWDELLAGICIPVDGRTVGLYGPHEYFDKRLSSTSPDLALECFNMMLKHCPEALERIRTSDDKCTKEHLVPRFPFDRLNTISNTVLENVVTNMPNQQH